MKPVEVGAYQEAVMVTSVEKRVDAWAPVWVTVAQAAEDVNMVPTEPRGAGRCQLNYGEWTDGWPVASSP